MHVRRQHRYEVVIGHRDVAELRDRIQIRLEARGRAAWRPHRMRDERGDTGQPVEVDGVRQLHRRRLDVALPDFLDRERGIERAPRNPDVGLIGDVEPNRDVVDGLLLKRLPLGGGIALRESKGES